MDKLRVLVADDKGFMRVAYRRILETQEHIEVVVATAKRRSGWPPSISQT